MEEYRIGALSQLISCNTDEKGGEIDDDLFKASPLPVNEVTVEEVQTENVEDSVQSQGKSPKKKKKHSKKDNTNEAIENEVITENDDDSAQGKSLKKTKKKSKKISSEDKDDSDEDDLSVKYKQPSSKFQVIHEEENRTKPRDEDKEKRTIFIGNLPSNATKQQIKSLLRECGEIETIRFRGAARPDMITTKKQSIIQRKFHEKRHNIIAYARFKDVECTHKSLKLDGHKIGEQTIRIDLAASKEDTSQNRDQSKAIFVGNLGFATDEDQVREHFGQCGKITEVRIVRDSQTGIGKGFCYVNFASSESVKTALDLMSKTTLCGRELRISQSVSRPKKDYNHGT